MDDFAERAVVVKPGLRPRLQMGTVIPVGDSPYLHAQHIRGLRKQPEPAPTAYFFPRFQHGDSVYPDDRVDSKPGKPASCTNFLEGMCDDPEWQDSMKESRCDRADQTLYGAISAHR